MSEKYLVKFSQLCAAVLVNRFQMQTLMNLHVYFLETDAHMANSTNIHTAGTTTKSVTFKISSRNNTFSDERRVSQYFTFFLLNEICVEQLSHNSFRQAQAQVDSKFVPQFTLNVSKVSTLSIGTLDFCLWSTDNTREVIQSSAFYTSSPSFVSLWPITDSLFTCLQYCFA
jgi:hypothetical protein